MEVIHKLVDNQMIEHMSFASMEVLEDYVLNVLDKKEEVFKCVKDHPDYFISTKGRLISGKTTKLCELSPYNNEKNYVCISLGHKPKKKYRVHRLVADSFLISRKSEDRNFVNHKDLVKTNNNVRNLEWVSISENNRHAHANGAYDKFSVNKKVKEEDIHNICKILQSGNYSNHDNVLEQCNLSYLNRTVVSKINRRKTYHEITKLYPEFKDPNEKSLNKIFTDKNNQKFSNDLCKQVCELLQEGNSVVETSKILNLTGNDIKIVNNIKLRKYYTEISKDYNFDKSRNKFRLSEDDVIQIIDLIKAKALSLKDISIKFNAALSTIYNIKQCRTWKHLTVDKNL